MISHFSRMWAAATLVGFLHLSCPEFPLQFSWPETLYMCKKKILKEIINCKFRRHQILQALVSQDSEGLVNKVSAMIFPLVTIVPLRQECLKVGQQGTIINISIWIWINCQHPVCRKGHQWIQAKKQAKFQVQPSIARGCKPVLGKPLPDWLEPWTTQLKNTPQNHPTQAKPQIDVWKAQASKAKSFINEPKRFAHHASQRVFQIWLRLGLLHSRTARGLAIDLLLASPRCLCQMVFGSDWVWSFFGWWLTQLSFRIRTDCFNFLVRFVFDPFP